MGSVRVPRLIVPMNSSAAGLSAASAFPTASATASVRVHRPPARVREDRATALVASLAGLGLGVVLGAALLTLGPVEASWTWVTTAVGRVSAVVGTYGMLWMIVLVARVPPVERALGHDRLVAVHKRVAPWTIWLVLVHIVFSVLAWSGQEGVSLPAELWSMTLTEPWILAADVAVILLVAAGVTSYRRARRRLRREVWWTVHLYTYLAVALAFAHQITVDGPFLSGWARWVWIGLYLVVAGLVVVHRVALPLIRSLRHDLRVERVVPEAEGVVSVWMRGRDLDALGVRPGQFANWRFMAPRLAYEAHPYSFSAPVRQDLMRITVKNLGDASALTARLAPGTRVLMEGPYGTMTAANLGSAGRTVLVAAGVGLAPARALAEDLSDAGVRVDLVVRVPSPSALPLDSELRVLERWPGVRVHRLVGHRDSHPMDAAQLLSLVPDLREADLYVCGPEAFNRLVLDSARAAGLSRDRLHHEELAM